MIKRFGRRRNEVASGSVECRNLRYRVHRKVAGATRCDDRQGTSEPNSPRWNCGWFRPRIGGGLQGCPRAAGGAGVVLERLADRGAGVLRAAARPASRLVHRPEPTDPTSPMRRLVVAPRAGQGVRPPAAGADGFRTAAATVERAEAQRSRGTAPVPAYDRDGAGGAPDIVVGRGTTIGHRCSRSNPSGGRGREESTSTERS